MTNPPHVLRARSRRDFQELAAYLEDQSWRAFAILIGERLDARARALALAFVAACAFVLVASALASGC